MASITQPLNIEAMFRCIAKIMMPNDNVASNPTLLTSIWFNNETASYRVGHMLMCKYLRSRGWIAALLILVLINSVFMFPFRLAGYGFVFSGSMHRSTARNALASAFVFAEPMRVKLRQWLMLVTDIASLSKHGMEFTMAYGQAVR